MQLRPHADGLYGDQEVRASYRVLNLLLSMAELVSPTSRGQNPHLQRQAVKAAACSFSEPTGLCTVGREAWCLRQNQRCSVGGCYALQAGWHAH